MQYCLATSRTLTYSSIVKNMSGASRTILGPVNSSHIIITPLNQGTLVARLRSPVQFYALRHESDGHTAIRDVSIVLVFAIWSLERRICIIHSDNRSCARQARQGVLAGHEGSFPKTALYGRVCDGEACAVCRRTLPDADGDVVLGRVYRIELGGRLDLPGQRRGERLSVGQKACEWYAWSCAVPFSYKMRPSKSASSRRWSRRRCGSPAPASCLWVVRLRGPGPLS